MIAPTPGRAAYEARLSSRAARLGHAYGIGQFRPPWDKLADVDQADEEAGAQAAVRATPLYAELAAQLAEASAELAALRELLDEIGVMAANAPEDGDSFGLLEEIAMRIAAAGVPDSTPLDEWPDPENPVTGRTPGPAAAPELAAATPEQIISVSVRSPLPGEDKAAYEARLDTLFAPVRAETDRLRAELEGTDTCRHCRKPIAPCDGFPPHAGCGSGYGWIHTDPDQWGHSCQPRSGAPYARPAEQDL